MAGNPQAKALHASDPIGVFLVTGGGITLLEDLLTEPGASATVLEASVPYAEQALADKLGGKPDRACSADTARALAMAAYQRAIELRANEEPEKKPLFGFGCTAALATNRKKRGKHRAHLALQTSISTATASIEFDKGVDGMGDRLEEEATITLVAWRLLEKALGIALNPPALNEQSEVSFDLVEALPAWAKLLNGDISATSTLPSTQKPKALISGSFNPLHKGHLKMASIASTILETDVAYELCIDNVDKPALGFFEMRDRSKQFSEADGRTLWLTRLPTFVEKAREFPNCTFVVGVDTLVRIGMPRYYQSEEAMLAAFKEFAELGVSFLVFGRAENIKGDNKQSGQTVGGAAVRFQTLATVDIPKSLRSLCKEVPEQMFRIDISSSELRDDADRA